MSSTTLRGCQVPGCLCQLTQQQLQSEGISLRGHCWVGGCRHDYAYHENDIVPTTDAGLLLLPYSQLDRLITNITLQVCLK